VRTGKLLAAAALLLASHIAAGCAGRHTAADLTLRADRIAMQIERAEQMGASKCAPRELARAKVQLEHALHELAEGHYPAAWTSREFDEAERVADEMLRGRILAQRSGFRCFHREG